MHESEVLHRVESFVLVKVKFEGHLNEEHVMNFKSKEH